MIFIQCYYVVSINMPQNLFFFAKSAMKIIAPTIESEHSFSTGTFLNNYDVRDRKPQPSVTGSTLEIQ